MYVCMYVCSVLLVDFLLLCLWSTIAFTMHAVSKERIVQTQNFVFGRFSNFFFYPNETWTHPPTSNFFLDFWNFFNFAKPLSKKYKPTRVHKRWQKLNDFQATGLKNVY